MSYTLTTLFATDAAGQTLNAQLVDTTGANVGAAVTTGFVDLGLGLYLGTLTYPTAFRGGAIITAAGVVKTAWAINPQEGENVDALVSSRADGASYTTARAGKLDQLDAAVSSRLAASAYTVAPTAAAVRDAVLNELLNAHTGAGSVGEALGRLDVVLSTRAATADARLAHLDADVSSRADASVYTSTRAALLDRLDVAVSSRLATAGYTVPPAVAAIVAGVLDELVASHAGAGSVGAFLARLDATVTSRAAIADWTTARAAKVDNLDATITSRATQTSLDAAKAVVDAVKAVTDRIVFAASGPSDIVTRLSATGVQGVWDALSSALTTAGSIGKRLVDSLDVAVSTRASSSAFADLVVNVSEVVDPLTHPVPEGYPAGSAGDALGKLADLFRVTPIVLDRDAVTVVRGQDYTGADVLQFTNLQWPDLTGAVVQLRAQLGTSFLNKTAVVVAPRLITVALSEVETNALEPGVYTGDLHASLASGESRSLQRIVIDASYATA